MKSLNELRNQWNDENPRVATINDHELRLAIRQRAKKQTSTAFQYFWAAFVLQLLVYALLTHVIIRHYNDLTIAGMSLAGIAIYIPFTVVLMKKFKAMAVTPLTADSTGSMGQYVHQQRELLSSFFKFKKRYEWMLVPVSSAIGTFVAFRIWVPGGIAAHPTGALITLAITLISCVLAIRSENRKNFAGPLERLDDLSKELKG